MRFGLFAAIALLAACGAESGAARVDASADATTSETEPPRNLLTLAEGAVVLAASTNAHDAHALTDGAEGSNWSNGGPRFVSPFTFVFELRAPTRLARIGVEGAGARPGGVAGASANRVRIEASSESPEAGFVALGAIDANEEGETLIEVSLEQEVRWLRFTIENNHGGAHWTYLDGVAAYGAQTPPTSDNRFTGVFQVGRNGLIELKQSGASIAGCYLEQGGFGSGELSGTVVDGVARLQWRSEDGIEGPAIVVLDSRGHLNGVRYRDRSRSVWGGPPAPQGAATPCSSVAAPANPIAEALESQGEARIYDILFDFDRATLKSSSEPALRQLLEALEANAALAVDVEGHTDAMGEDAYNLALSQQRAQSVIAWLTENEIPAARLNAVGKGESEPVASNVTADGRALNRRVEVSRRN